MNLNQEEQLFISLFKDYVIERTKEGTGWEIRKNNQLVRASELVGTVKKYQEEILGKVIQNMNIGGTNEASQ